VVVKINNTQNITAIRQELLSRLREERISQGLSQKDVAQKTGLSPMVISKMENGQNIRFSSFLDYLKALGKIDALDELIPESGPKPTDLVKMGKPRQRFYRKRTSSSSDWKWGDEK
jgi:transcriptional regulator with XRE-family HTH domain